MGEEEPAGRHDPPAPAPGRGRNCMRSVGLESIRLPRGRGGPCGPVGPAGPVDPPAPVSGAGRDGRRDREQAQRPGTRLAHRNVNVPSQRQRTFLPSF